MKKYLYSLMVVMFAAFSFTLTSCGDDDDEPDGGKVGKVTIAYEGTITKTLSATEATWHPRSQTVVGTGHYDLDEGATFQVYLMDDDYNGVYLQFQTREEIVQGGELNVDTEALFFYPIFDSSQPLRHQEIGGRVNIKSISGDKITLEFKDFSFLREVNNDGKTQKVTVNGTVTYEQD